ncbi:hypothetical protein NEDG_01783 [Nematocida displodere]|uniref:Uncharacterized protein n=1 Tax=Nematocida displodere TaxID=1805483 RepID=A0A177EH59_9MICR|nr:hypothetical protein NEDG_01783 [Nematocida displodere]
MQKFSGLGPNTNTKIASTHPNHANHLPRIIFAMAALLQALGVFGATDSELPQCLSSPHTAPTLAFFVVSGCELETQSRDGVVYIVKNQEWRQTKIHLNKYTLKNVPTTLVSGMVFGNLTIDQDYTPTQDLALNRAVLEKIFRALGTISANRLIIDGVVNITEPKKNISVLKRGLKALTSPCTSFSGSLPDPDPTPNSNPSPSPNPNRLLLVNTKHLWLRYMSEASIQWFLEHLDACNCELSLWIEGISNITNLQFLDSFNPMALVDLSLLNLKNLSNIDCVLLKEKKILFGLELSETQTNLCASSETLQAIGTKPWDWLTMPMNLWDIVACEASGFVAVNNLNIVADFTESNDLVWHATYPEKASVTKLTLTLTQTCPKSAQTLKKIFGWVDACFVDTVRVKIVAIDAEHPLMPLGYQYLSLESLLPEVRFLECKLTLEHTMHLYSSKSVLWISPDAYHMWASGQLNEEMEAVTHNLLYCVEGSTPTPPFLPPARPNLNPACFECGISLDAIQKMNSPRSRPYVGIVCEGGHMACQPCLKKLARAQKDTNAPLSCPHCHSDISLGQTNGVIERYKQIADCFNITRFNTIQWDG